MSFYRGRELQRRLAERLKEAESDTRDREKEKDELEELKSKIFSSAYEDPTAEFEKVKIIKKTTKPNKSKHNIILVTQRTGRPL